MSMIYIGSSKVYRFEEILDQEVQNTLSMRRCTKVEVFCAVMNALKESDGMIIISLIENFLPDYVGERKVKEEVEKAVGKAQEDFVKTVDETAKRLPKTRFAIVEPMERPAVGWYTRGLKDITNEYSRMLNSLGMVNIMIIKRVELPEQIFDKQKRSGRQEICRFNTLLCGEIL